MLLLRVTLENMKDDVGSAGISAGLEARAGGGCNLRNAVGGLGSRLEENKGHTQIKKSPDMKQWEYVHD